MHTAPPLTHSPAPINTVIFDLGGVLIDWNPRYLYRQIFADPGEMESFLSSVCNQAWNEQQDAGRPWAEAVRELTARHPDHATAIAAYHERWPETLGGEIADTVDILSRLKTAGLRLYALTNWSAETFPVALERFAFLSWFAGIVVSGEERLIKPDPRLFEVMLSRYDIDRSRALFIDDSARNVAAAGNLGLRSLHFTDPDTLRRDLESAGIAL
ncbi:HAD family hydrolase [Paludibacterium paludis]|uniref:Hydrolase n=1 Tax=Paludibacterium paludis TaxID=1225769 RepID=A0A918P253_9NEIS|nr:HAD family phosphatase [Paludibacterium paludis]GGY13759.1 hydrolase [Paludibacterium paludis]